MLEMSGPQLIWAYSNGRPQIRSQALKPIMPLNLAAGGVASAPNGGH